jgi:prolyl oligopeptidase
VTDQVWYESLDGTRVSMFIVHRRDLPRDGRQPVRLSGYGGFNIPVEPRFTPLHAAWLKLGGVLAFANVRGGGEYGREWHEAARKTRRQNVFDDYIAAARWLVTAGYTTPARLASPATATAASSSPSPPCRHPRRSEPSSAACPPSTCWALRDPAPAEEPSSTARPTIRSRAGISPGTRRITSGDDLRVGAQRPHRAAARSAQDGRQAPGRAGAGRALSPPAAPGSGHAGGTTLTALVEQDVDELSFYCWALDVAPPAE